MDDTPTLADLIKENASKLSTEELVTLIAEYHPGIEIPEIVAELRRQAEADFAEADRLKLYGAFRL